MTGKRPATVMLKTVIASAARRIGLRQLAWERRRIADTMVPEWERPTQKTKLTM